MRLLRQPEIGWLRWAVYLGVLAALALLGEGAARMLVGGQPRDIFAAGRNGLPHGLQPGLHLVYEIDGTRRSLNTDNAGRRVTGAALDRPDRRHVFVLGDGIAFGWGLSDVETVAALLQAALGNAYFVVNAAVPGYGPSQYMTQLASIPLDALAVLLLSEVDDLVQTARGGTDQIVLCGYLVPEESMAARLPCWLLQSKLVALLTGWTEPEPPQRLLPLGYRPNVRSGARLLRYRLDRLLTRHTRDRGPHLLVAVVPWDAAVVRARMGSYDTAMAEVSRHTTVADAIDLSEDFMAHPDPTTLFGVGSYLSPAGAAVVADRLAEAIQSLGAEVR